MRRWTLYSRPFNGWEWLVYIFKQLLAEAIGTFFLCFAGIGAIVMDACRVGEKSLVAAGSLLSPGTIVPPRSLVMGVPARVVRHVDDGLRARIRGTWEHYVEQAARHRSGAYPVERTSL